MKCNLCAKKCNKERNEVLGDGECNMPTKMKIAYFDAFFYEEPCLTGKGGSGAIFFSGCSLNCVYCQNFDISTQKNGKFYSVDEFIDIIKSLEKKGIENINLVNPTHYALQIVSALKKYKPSIPVVWNSHGYETVETINLVSDYVDIFLPDFKYISDISAKRYSGVENYFSVASLAISHMRKIKEDNFDENGVMKTGLIIRHLILPLHSADSEKILKFIAENYKNTYVSLMAQFVPCGLCESFKEINRVITKREYKKVKNKFLELNLNGYIQDRSSATKDFIPNFLDNL